MLFLSLASYSICVWPGIVLSPLCWVAPAMLVGLCAVLGMLSNLSCVLLWLLLSWCSLVHAHRLCGPQAGCDPRRILFICLSLVLSIKLLIFLPFCLYQSYQPHNYHDPHCLWQCPLILSVPLLVSNKVSPLRKGCWAFHSYVWSFSLGRTSASLHCSWRWGPTFVGVIPLYISEYFWGCWWSLILLAWLCGLESSSYEWTWVGAIEALFSAFHDWVSILWLEVSEKRGKQSYPWHQPRIELLQHRAEEIRNSRSLSF